MCRCFVHWWLRTDSLCFGTVCDYMMLQCLQCSLNPGKFGFMAFKCVIDHFSTRTVAGTRHESVDGQRKVGRCDSRRQASGAFGHKLLASRRRLRLDKRNISRTFFAELYLTINKVREDTVCNMYVFMTSQQNAECGIKFHFVQKIVGCRHLYK